MSKEITYELSGILAAEIDSFANMIDQRDQARGIAIELEGEVNALTIERDALIAQLAAIESVLDQAEQDKRDCLPPQMAERAIDAGAVEIMTGTVRAALKFGTFRRRAMLGADESATSS